jgi:hypothetical protein
MKLLALLLALVVPASAVDVESTNVVSVISIHGDTFSNAVLIDLSPQSATIQHSRGIASFNLGMLRRGDKEQLGIIPRAAKVEKKLNDPAEGATLRQIFARIPVATNMPAIGTNQAAYPAQFGFLQKLNREDIEKALKALPPAFLALLLVPVAAYLFLCFCFHLICKKAGAPSPLVWIPLVQMLALYRAAKMSPWWFAPHLVPVVMVVAIPMLPLQSIPPPVLIGSMFGMAALSFLTLIGWVIWCFKICTARGKSPLAGVGLLLPGVNLVALCYLAFSK